MPAWCYQAEGVTMQFTLALFFLYSVKIKLIHVFVCKKYDTDNTKIPDILFPWNSPCISVCCRGHMKHMQIHAYIDVWNIAYSLLFFTEGWIRDFAILPHSINTVLIFKVTAWCPFIRWNSMIQLAIPRRKGEVQMPPGYCVAFTLHTVTVPSHSQLFPSPGVPETGQQRREFPSKEHISIFETGSGRGDASPQGLRSKNTRLYGGWKGKWQGRKRNLGGRGPKYHIWASGSSCFWGPRMILSLSSTRHALIGKTFSFFSCG